MTIDFITQEKDYWIASSALNITLNALGNQNRIQCSVTSGAVIRCFYEHVDEDDSLGYTVSHGYRQWSLTASPTYFNSDTSKYVYVAIPRKASVGTDAVVVFPSEKLDIYGRVGTIETDPETGEETIIYQQVGSTDYFYVWLQAIISAPVAIGGVLQRQWTTQIATGKLDTPQGDAEREEESEWYQWSIVGGFVTFLKEIRMSAESWFVNIRLGENKHELTGVATSETLDEYIDSDKLVVTPSYLKDRFLRKDKDDATPFSLGVGENLTVGEDLNIGGNVEITGQERVDRIQSHNYSGSGLADTGYLITNDNGSGSSLGIFDYLTIRKKMIINSLEIKETHFTAGDVAQTLASAEIARTDYFYVDENGKRELLGYSSVLVPWSLKNRLLALAKGDLRGIFGHYKQVRMTLTKEELMRCNRIRCYFLAKDGERSIENWFRPGDLARCQTWNVLKTQRETFIPNLEEHAGNVYWWREIHDVSWNTGVTRYVAKDNEGQPTDQITTDSQQAYENENHVKRLYDNGIYHTEDTEGYDDHQPVTIEGNTYHWFDVEFDYLAEQAGSTASADAHSDIPAAGDKVVQFGNAVDPDRMNVVLTEVNGSGNPDAPAIKMLRGVYTFDLNECWWGGVTEKIKISPSTGIRLFAPMFEWGTETGNAKQINPRPEHYWTEIALERDDWTNQHISDIATYYPNYSDDIVDNNGRFQSRGGFVIENGKKRYGSALNPIPKNYVRKCRYYDQVSHNGSMWLTSFEEHWYWIDRQGNAVDGQTAGGTHVRSYTTQEPTPAANDWTLQVDTGAFKSSVFCRSNSIPARPSNTKTGSYNTYENPIPPVVSGQPTWTDGIPSGSSKVWMSTAWFDVNGIQGEWTPPRQQTDTETLDIEFSFNSTCPEAPEGTAANKDTAAIKTKRHNQGGTGKGWYDPSDTLPSGYTWEDMKWRAERKIKNGVYYGSWAITRIKGENAVRIDLSNENDSILYDNNGKKLSNDVTSVARLWDGSVDVSDNDKTSWSVSANGCSVSSGNSRNITVTGMSDATASVTVTATYTDVNGTSYTRSAVLSLKKLVDVDKYDLDITPNALFLNTSKGWSNSKTLTVKVMRTPAAGGAPSAVNPADYNLAVQGTVGTLSSYDSSTGSFTLTVSQTEATNNENTVVTLYDENDSSKVYDRETIPFNKAEDGKSITKKSESYRYATNDTGVRPASTSSEWKTTKPTLAKGYWLYTETTITWSDNSTTVLYTDERNPNDGIKGQDIIVDGSTIMKYYVGDSNTTHPAEDSSDWKDLNQVTQTQGKWLWSQATTWYRKADSTAGKHDAGKSVTYNVNYISTDGKTGRGISSITEYYQATNSSDARQAPTSAEGWSTDPNLSDLTDKWGASHKYLWNMEMVVYSNVDSSETTEYTVPQILAIWTEDGDPGQGIDSIQNKYCVTNTVSPVPARAHEQGGATYQWSDTPKTPAKGQYLWNYEVITWVNPSKTTYTSVQMIGYAGTDGHSPQVEIIGGYWYIDGQETGVKAEGTDGTGVEIKGTVATPAKLTIEGEDGYAVPMNNDGTDGQKVKAKHGDCYICDLDRHLYMFTKTPSLAWNDLGEFKGEPGKNSYVHIAYATGNPLNVTTSTVNNIGFTVNNAGTEYDWWGFCTDNNVNDPGRNWSELTNAQKVAVVNTYKWNYMKGKDGNGVEYIYLLTKEGFTPTINPNSYTDTPGHIAAHGDPTKDEFYPIVDNYSGNQSKIYPGTGTGVIYWDDDPAASVSETWPLLWWAKRKFVNGSWSAFGNVDLHNRYSKDGNGIVSITRTFARSSVGTTASETTEPAHDGSWTTSSPAVNEQYPYLWAKEQVVFTDQTKNTTKYYCIGTRGDNGVDAQDFEWVYVRTTNNVAPTIVASSGTDYWKQDDFKPLAKVSSGRIKGATEGDANVAVRCTDDPRGVDETWRYEWEIKRTKGAAVNGHREWNNYTPDTAMTLHNNYASSNLQIDIDNDNDEFGADSESKVLIEQSRSTTVSMYYGKEVQTITALSAVLKYSDDDTDVPSSVAGVTRDLSTGNVVVTIHQGTFSKSGLYALITAGCSLGTMKIRFTVTKLLGGTKGETPIIYQLDLTQKTLSYGRDASNNLVAISNSVTVRVKRTEGNDSQIKTLAESGKTCTWGYDGTYNTTTLDPAAPTIIIPAANVGNHTKVSIALSTGDKENVTIVKDGANGAPGNTVRTVSIYKWSKTTPSNPGNDTSIPPTGWSTTDSGTHDADALLWMCWGEAVNGVLTDDKWSGPVRMSGKDGSAGADGETYEYIYKQTNTLNGYGQHPKDIDTPDPHSTGQSKTDDDFVPDGWTDNPQGVSSSMKYEYCAIREKTKTGWSNFQDPFPWSVYGDKGQDGDGVEYVFVRTNSETAPTITNNDSYTEDGRTIDYTMDEFRPMTSTGERATDDPTGLDSNHKYEWVAMRTMSAPVNGVRTWNQYALGAMALWAKYSVDGKRGDFKSRVFTRTDSDISNTKPTGGTYDSPLPSPATQGGVTWSDGIPTGSAKIWTSVRTFKGDGTETTWSLPVLEGDSADLDVEFSLSETQPSAPTGSTPHSDHSSDGWYDPSLNQTLPTGKTWSDMIWRAERRVSGASYSGNWVISRIKGEQGAPATISINEDGYWVINGVTLDVKAEGSDGTGVNIKGTVAAVTDMTVENNIGYVKPVGESKKAAEDGDSYVCEANRHLYIWLEAQKLWKDLGEFKGEPGKNSYMHIAYATGNPLNVTTSTVNNIGFTVNNAGTEYDWWGFCTDNNVNDPGRNWSELTNAQKVEVVNTYKWNYMKGKDGDGVEYIYLLTKEGVVTPTIDATGYSGDHGDPTKDEFYPRVANYSPTTMQSNTWSDDPVDGVSRTWPLLWWAKREYDNGAWQAFKTAKLHARWSEDGGTPESRYQWNQDASNPPTYDANQQNPGSLWLTAPANRPGNGYYLWMITAVKSAAGVYGTWGSPVRLTGDTGSAGEDAKEREWVYKRVDANPGTPPSSGTGTVNGVEKAYSDTIDDWVPAGWQDNPLGVTNENKTEWASWRDFNKTTKKWGPFNVPFIWSHYGERGMDGDGVEYVFIRTNSDTAPTITNNNSYTEDGKTIDYTMDEFRPMTSEGRATDDPTGIDSTHKYEWVAMRTKGAPVNGVRTWNQYTLGAMALWAKYGDKGAPAGNTATIYLYKRYASEPQSWQNEKPTSTLYYKFSTKKLYTTSACTTEATSELNGWSLTIPSGTDQIYITAAVAYSNDSVDSNMDVDDIDKNEWVTPAEFSGADGINSATVFLYQRSASAPTGENECPQQTLYYKFADGELYTYNVSTGVYTQVNEGDAVLKGWKLKMPSTNGYPCYVIQAAALSAGDYDAIEVEKSGSTYTKKDWSSVRKLVEDGEPGKNSVRIDLDNQADLVSLDSDDNVSFAHDVIVRARIYDGATPAKQNVALSDTKENLRTAWTIGTCKPSVSDIDSNGVMTVKWEFTAGMAVAATSVTLSLKYNNVPYTAVFTLGTTKSQAIWQVLPNPSEVSFSKSSANTLVPSSITLKCGYTRYTGSGTDSVSEAIVDSDGQITVSGEGTGVYIYYHSKTVSNNTETWSAWTKYTAAGISVANSTTVTDYEFCITEGAMNNNQTNIIDRECVPIVKDGVNGDKGENAISLTLDNEHEDFLYTETGTLVAPLEGATSPVHLYDGASEKTSSVTFQVYDDATSSWGTQTGSSASAAASISGSTLTVSGIRAGSVKVKVRAEYPTLSGKYYYAEFTANKTSQDKYDIIVRPNAIAFNASETWADKTITIESKGINEQGGELTPTISTGNTYAKGQFRVFWGYVKGNGKIYKPSKESTTPTEGTDDLKAITKTVNSTEANAYIGIYFELRLYTSASAYRLCDYETVEIAKSQNGGKGQSSFKSTVFTRTNETPIAPDSNYGSYASPNPPETGSDRWVVKKDSTTVISNTYWHDGIPSGDAKLWASTRIFTSDGQLPQQSTWTTPSQMTDTETYDVEFAKKQTDDATPTDPTTNPNIWYDPVRNPSEDFTKMYWRAERECKNGVWGSWVIVRIKGEQGAPGGKATRVTNYFLALGGDTQPAVPAVNTDVIPPTSTIGGTIRQWQPGAADPAWSDTNKYLYEIDYYQLSDGGSYWSNAYFKDEWAAQGPQGDDAVNVSLSPENIILEQDIETNVLSLAKAYTDVTIDEGGSPKTNFTITNITASRVGNQPTCDASIDSTSYPHRVRIISINTYNTTIDGRVVSRYYDTGYVTFDVEYGDTRYNKRLNFAVNQPGLWKTFIKNDVFTEIGNSTWFDIDANGNIVESDRLGTFVRSSQQNLSRLNEDSFYKIGTWTNTNVVISQDEIDTYGNFYRLVFDMTLQGSDVDLEEVNVSFYKRGDVGRPVTVSSLVTFDKQYGLTAGTWTLSITKVGGGSVNVSITNLALYTVTKTKTSVLSQTVGEISATVSDSEIGNSALSIRANGLTSTVNAIQMGKNLLTGVLTGAGWKSNSSRAFSGMHDASVDSDGWINVYSGDSYVVSPAFNIENGKEYTFSYEKNTTGNNRVYVGYDNNGTFTPIDNPMTTGSTYRKSINFTCSAAAVGKNIYIYVYCSKIIRPQVELGEEATAFESGDTEMSSQIKQTADNINLSVRQDLQTTGVDITHGLIKLIANKTQFLTSSNVPMIAVQMCDANGNVGTGSAYTIPSIVFYDGQIGNGGSVQWVLNYLGFTRATNAGARFSWEEVYTILDFEKNPSSQEKYQHEGIDEETYFCIAHTPANNQRRLGLANRNFYDENFIEVMYLFTSGYYINQGGTKVYQPAQGINYQCYQGSVTEQRYWLTDATNSDFVPDDGTYPSPYATPNPGGNHAARGYYYVDEGESTAEWPTSDKWYPIETKGPVPSPVVYDNTVIKKFSLVYFNDYGVPHVYKNAFLVAMQISHYRSGTQVIPYLKAATAKINAPGYDWIDGGSGENELYVGDIVDAF